MSSKLFTFARGGIHPPEHKELCDASKYSILPTPSLVTIPLAMHLGAPAKAVVANREEVEAGQLVGEASGFVSSNTHTPFPGKVKAPLKVYLGAVTSPAIPVAVDPETAVLQPFENEIEKLDLDAWEPRQIIDRIAECGIVGMGGASFPTHVKLSPPPGAKIDTLVINGAECEPYLTADDCLMRNHAGQLIEGVRALMKATGVVKAYIGIEHNKPEAYEIVSKAAQGEPSITVGRLKTQYPQGAEKQLIEALTGRRVAPGKLPFTVGVVVQNVATTVAVYEALQYNRPLTRRLMTVSGKAVANPQNVLAPVGVTVREILDFCGGLKGECGAVILGGPMMGRATTDLDEPVTKGTSGILFLSPEEIQDYEELPCIRCGQCLTVCPMGLVPTEIMGYAEINRFEDAKDALDCIECGSCSYVCPSNRRLVHWIRLAKWELNRMRRREQLRKQQEEREEQEKQKAREAIANLPE